MEENDGQIPPTSPPRAMIDKIAAMAQTNGVLQHWASILKSFLIVLLFCHSSHNDLQVFVWSHQTK